MSLRSVALFLVDPSALFTVRLRRFGYGGLCRCCNAEVEIDRRPVDSLPDGLDGWGRSPESAGISRADPRWPVACATCRREFTPDQEWQWMALRLHHPVGKPEELFTLADAPAGAMWRARDLEHAHVGPDEMCWEIVLPDGSHWQPDVPPRGHTTAWRRTGTPPRLTCHPSIRAPGGWHGWLRDGMLEPCGDSLM